MTTEDEDTAMGIDGVSQTLEAMMRIDAVRLIQLGTGHGREPEAVHAASLTASPSTSYSIRRRATRRQPSHVLEPDLAEDVRQSVAKRMREVSLFTSPTTDEDSMSEDEQSAPHRRRPLKSGM